MLGSHIDRHGQRNLVTLHPRHSQSRSHANVRFSHERVYSSHQTILTLAYLHLQRMTFWHSKPHRFPIVSFHTLQLHSAFCISLERNWRKSKQELPRADLCVKHLRMRPPENALNVPNYRVRIPALDRVHQRELDDLSPTSMTRFNLC